MNVILCFVIGLLLGYIVCFGLQKIEASSVQVAGDNSVQVQSIGLTSIKSNKPYMNPRRVLAWDDLVPWGARGKHSMWSDSEIISDPQTKFEHVWERVKNGKNFRYYKDNYEFDIAFDAGDFGWVTLNHSCGTFTICCHKTGYRHHLPYGHEHTAAYYCEDMAKWYSDIYKKAEQEWKNDMNL